MTTHDLKEWLERRFARLYLFVRRSEVYCTVVGAGVDVTGSAPSVEQAVELAKLLFETERARQELARQRAQS